MATFGEYALTNTCISDNINININVLKSFYIFYKLAQNKQKDFYVIIKSKTFI